jgi:hypothetical protein
VREAAGQAGGDRRGMAAQRWLSRSHGACFVSGWRAFSSVSLCSSHFCGVNLFLWRTAVALACSANLPVGWFIASGASCAAKNGTMKVLCLTAILKIHGQVSKAAIDARERNCG